MATIDNKAALVSPDKLQTSPLEIVQDYLATPNLPFSFKKKELRDILGHILSRAEEIRSLLQNPATKDKQAETVFERISWEGPFTGKEEKISAGIQNGNFKIGSMIGKGAEGDVYDCELLEKAKPEFPLVVKVVRPGSLTRKEYVDGSLDKPFTTVAMHAQDELPVLPRYVGMATVEGNPAMVMEKISDPPLTEYIKEKVMEEKDVIKGILPLVKFLVFEQRQGHTLRDNKMTDIRIGTEGQGIYAHPYFRLIDFGVSKIRETDKLQDTQSGFTSVGSILLFSLVGRDADLTGLESVDKRTAQNALNKLSTDNRFRRLTPATQYVILKTLGKTPDRYTGFDELENDLTLIDIMSVLASGRVDKNTLNALFILGEKGSDKMVGRALKLNFYETSNEKPKLAAAVEEDAKAVGQEITRICAPPPPETREEKNERLDQNRGHIIYILGITVKHGHATKLAEWGGTLDKYLSERPKDAEVQYWGWLAQAMDTVWRSGLMEDPEFNKSYLGLCQSLQIDNKEGKREFLPLEELKAKAQPIINLQQMILGVLNAQKK